MLDGLKNFFEDVGIEVRYRFGQFDRWIKGVKPTITEEARAQVRAQSAAFEKEYVQRQVAAGKMSPEIGVATLEFLSDINNENLTDDERTNRMFNRLLRITLHECYNRAK